MKTKNTLSNFLFLMFAGIAISASSIDIDKSITITEVGAAQGISIKNDRLYVYGDVYKNKKHTGIIRELNQNLKPTGRTVWLTKNNKSIIKHPTGLTFHPQWGTIIGDTVNGAGIIYQLDWPKMWKDGNLDNAIVTIINDDLAINGTRPEFVRYKGKDLIATADYGDKSPEIRLYDPKALIKHKRSSGPGVLISKTGCGPFNQNLHWDDQKQQLVFIQNVSAGTGWRLDIQDINQLFLKGADKSRVACLTLSKSDNSKTELEGFRPWKKVRGIFVTSNKKNNLLISKPLEALIK